MNYNDKRRHKIVSCLDQTLKQKLCNSFICVYTSTRKQVFYRNVPANERMIFYCVRILSYRPSIFSIWNHFQSLKKYYKLDTNVMSFQRRKSLEFLPTRPDKTNGGFYFKYFMFSQQKCTLLHSGQWYIIAMLIMIRSIRKIKNKDDIQLVGEFSTEHRFYLRRWYCKFSTRLVPITKKNG